MAERPNLPGVIPYLSVKGGKAAIAFYERAFAAETFDTAVADDGELIMNAQLRINGGVVMLSDWFEQYAGRPMPQPEAVTIHLQVDDADAWFDRAVRAGATVKMPLADQFWGDRYGQLQDPFGHSWSIGGPIKG